MRRLQDLQPVDVQVGARRHALHVLAVEADSVVLGGADAEASIRRRSGVVILFSAGGGVVALAGALEPGPMLGTVRFTVADSAGLGLRGFTAPVGTAVTVSVSLPGVGRVLEIGGRVVRTRPDDCGLAFGPDAHEVSTAIDQFVIAAGRCCSRAAARTDAQRPVGTVASTISAMTSRRSWLAS